jgi:quinol---cytochrome c reductase iron-sulfur subunit, bacillus type
VDVAAETEVLADFPLQIMLRVPVRDGWLTTLRDLGAVFLFRTGSGVGALSAVCPHLGCSVARDERGFACPCHDSRFGPDGAVLGGPSPRGLDPLPVRVVGGRVQVQALHFVSGTRERRSI